MKALVEKIEVKFPNSWSKSDEEIANEALKALKSNYSFPDDKVTVKVENGWLTLEGTLPWNYQKDEAKSCVNYLMGVKGVTNNISIKSDSHDTIEQKQVEEALARSLSVNDCDIKVSVSGTKVTLSGTVNSWYQKEEAGRIAWKTSGIWSVVNDLAVDYYYELIG